MENYHRVKQAAAILRVHHTTVIKWIQTGQLPARKRGPATNSPYEIADSDLVKFHQALHQQTT